MDKQIVLTVGDLNMTEEEIRSFLKRTFLNCIVACAKEYALNYTMIPTARQDRRLQETAKLVYAAHQFQRSVDFSEISDLGSSDEKE